MEQPIHSLDGRGDLHSGKTNFFEKRVGDYQKAGVMAKHTIRYSASRPIFFEWLQAHSEQTQIWLFNLKMFYLMGKFVISTHKTATQFNLKANNGQVILSSEGYTTKAACNNGIESVRKILPTTPFWAQKSTNGKWYFKSWNLPMVRSLAATKMYEKRNQSENGIQS